MRRASSRPGYGGFLPWIKLEFGWSERTAQRFMRVGELAAKCDKVSQIGTLSKSALYLLAAASTPPEVIDAVAERSERRNITAGQKAMAWAMLFPKPEKLKRKGDVPRGDFSKQSLSKARIVLDYSEPLARQVRDGLPLNDAYEDVRDAKKRGQSDDAKRAALEEEAPDLAALVEEEKMKLNEAHAAMLERRRERQTAIEQAKLAADRCAPEYIPKRDRGRQRGHASQGRPNGKLNMRCYFLTGGHIVAAEELAGVSDKEAIVEAHALFSQRESQVGAFEAWGLARLAEREAGAFEVWDQARLVVRHPPIVQELAWAGGGSAPMGGEARWRMVLTPCR